MGWSQKGSIDLLVSHGEKKGKLVNEQASDIFNLQMFFNDEWVVSVKNKQSYNVKEDLTILQR